MRNIVLLAGAALFAAAAPAGLARAQGPQAQGGIVVNPGPQAVAPGGGFRGGGGWAGRRWSGGPRYYGHSGWRGYPRYGYRRHRGYPFWGGFATGAIIGGALAYPPAYAYGYEVEPGYEVDETGLDPAVAACARRYRTYDIETQTYIVRPGVRRRCP